MVMEDFYLDNKAVQIVGKWIEESEEHFQDVYLTNTWYEPIGSGPGGIDEQERTFDTLQELGESS